MSASTTSRPLGMQSTHYIEQDTTLRGFLDSTTSSVPSIYSCSPDIISSMCSRLRATSQGLQTLAVLARTSYLFHDAALDILWHSINSLVPLLYTLPSDLCAINRIVKHGRTSVEINLARDAIPADFQRFKAYAARIVEIHDDTGSLGPLVDSCVWDQLELHRTEYDFPRLRSVAYGNATSRNTAYRYPVFLAISPSLRSVDIVISDHSVRRIKESYKTPAEIHRRVVEQLVVAPNLTTLLIKVDGFTDRYCATLRELSLPLATAIIAGSTSLTRISVPDIPLLSSAFARLASIPSLISVDIYLLSEDYSWDFGDHNGLSATSFALVEDLTVRSDSFDLCITLMRTFPFGALKTIRMATEDIVQPQLFRTFAETLATHPHVQVSAIDLELGRLMNEPLAEAVPVYLGADLAPLLALPALASLAVDGHCHVLLDDDALDAVSRAWPLITQLILQPARRSKNAQIAQGHNRHVARGTLFGLLAFAERCHNLQELGLELDFVTQPSEARLRRAHARVSRQALPCPLKTLIVGWSPLATNGELTWTLASALSAWFPRLEEILDSYRVRVISEEQWPAVRATIRINLYRPPEAHQAIHMRWQSVETLVPILARVRAEERKWRAAQVAVRAERGGTKLDVGSFAGRMD